MRPFEKCILAIKLHWSLIRAGDYTANVTRASESFPQTITRWFLFLSFFLSSFFFFFPTEIVSSDIARKECSAFVQMGLTFIKTGTAHRYGYCFLLAIIEKKKMSLPRMRQKRGCTLPQRCSSTKNALASVWSHGAVKNCKE